MALRRVTPRSVQRIGEVIDALGPEGRRVVFPGVRTERFERWAEGRGRISGADVYRLTHAFRNVDVIREAIARNRTQDEPLPARELRAELRTVLADSNRAAISRARGRRVMIAFRRMGWRKDETPPYVRR